MPCDDPWLQAQSIVVVLQCSMKSLALGAIRCYQRFISPHKGFCCAYRAHTGRASCSQLGYRVIQRWGVWGGLKVLRERLFRCGVAHRRYSPPVRHWHHHQAGYCDFTCESPCGLECGLQACSTLSSCDGPWDCGWGGHKKKDEEKWVYIPPNAKLRGQRTTGNE